MSEMANSRVARWWASAAALFAVALLSGCVSPSPHFSAPIEWGDGIQEIRHPTELRNEEVAASIRLLDDGEAWLSDFPQGSTVESSDETLCLNVTTHERYTGGATWSAKSDYRFALTFSDSIVNVFSGSARFGSENWSEARIVECGEPQVTWWLYLKCGDSGDYAAGVELEVVPCRWSPEG